jgi:hypothetical protein
VRAMTTRVSILGRHIFDVFPDNPDDPEAPVDPMHLFEIIAESG